MAREAERVKSVWPLAGTRVTVFHWAQRRGGPHRGSTRYSATTPVLIPPQPQLWISESYSPLCWAFTRGPVRRISKWRCQQLSAWPLPPRSLCLYEYNEWHPYLFICSDQSMKAIPNSSRFPTSHIQSVSTFWWQWLQSRSRISPLLATSSPPSRLLQTTISLSPRGQQMLPPGPPASASVPLYQPALQTDEGNHGCPPPASGGSQTIQRPGEVPQDLAACYPVLSPPHLHLASPPTPTDWLPLESIRRATP